jgi:hypothetical protein
MLWNNESYRFGYPASSIHSGHGAKVRDSRKGDHSQIEIAAKPRPDTPSRPIEAGWDAREALFVRRKRQKKRYVSLSTI